MRNHIYVYVLSGTVRWYSRKKRILFAGDCGFTCYFGEAIKSTIPVLAQEETSMAYYSIGRLNQCDILKKVKKRILIIMLVTEKYLKNPL